MTLHDAAESMKKTARMLSAWSKSMEVLTAADMQQLRHVFEREAARLRADVEEIKNPRQPEATAP